MNYLMIASMDCTQNTSSPLLLGTWFWDPVEPEAPRVLAMCTHNADKSASSTRYAAHDLIKNVSAYLTLWELDRRSLNTRLTEKF